MAQTTATQHDIRQTQTIDEPTCHGEQGAQPHRPVDSVESRVEDGAMSYPRPSRQHMLSRPGWVMLTVDMIEVDLKQFLHVIPGEHRVEVFQIRGRVPFVSTLQVGLALGGDQVSEMGECSRRGDLLEDPIGRCTFLLIACS
jgi:hypothetical protein